MRKFNPACVGSGSKARITALQHCCPLQSDQQTLAGVPGRALPCQRRRPAAHSALSTPITGIAGCCARAASGHAGRAAEKCDELAPVHSMTLSASLISAGGTLMPSALAVLRLMTSSNLLGCSIGMSPGFAPLRMFAT